MYGARHPALMNARPKRPTSSAGSAPKSPRPSTAWQREARTADARYEALSQNFENLKKQMGVVNDQSIGLEALERDATVNRNLLEAMLNRAKQSTGAEDDPAGQRQAGLAGRAGRRRRAYPPKALIAFLGVVGGLLLGCAIALLREGGDHTFRRADQIETVTGLPVLAMVPQVSGRTPPAMQVLRQPTSTYSEALRRLADRHRAVRSGRLAQDHPVQLGDAVGGQVGDGGLARPPAGEQRPAHPADRLRLAQPAPAPDLPLPQSRRPGQPAGRQGRSMLDDILIHHDALSGVDVLTAGNWSPRQAHLLGSRPHAPAARGARAALRLHHPRHRARAGDGRRARPVAPRRQGGVRGPLGPYAAGRGDRGPEADHRRPGRRGRRRAVARRVQAVPPIRLRRPVLRGQATCDCGPALP